MTRESGYDASRVSVSPIDRVLRALDRLDVEGVLTLLAPDVRLLLADGRRGEGTDSVRALLEDFVDKLRATNHRVTAQWHQDEVWIAEMDASYQLRDWLELGPLPRVVILRQAADGIADLRFYGAHERPMDEHRTGGEGLWIGGRWVPPM